MLLVDSSEKHPGWSEAAVALLDASLRIPDGVMIDGCYLTGGVIAVGTEQPVKLC